MIFFSIESVNLIQVLEVLTCEILHRRKKMISENRIQVKLLAYNTETTRNCCLRKYFAAAA